MAARRRCRLGRERLGAQRAISNYEQDDPANDGPEENLWEADQPLAGGDRSTPPNGETLLLPPLVLPPGRNPTGRNGENHGGAGEGPRT